MYVCMHVHIYMCLCVCIMLLILQGWEGYRWSCYLFVSETRSWTAASRACQSFGATLVRIDDR